MKLKFPNYGKEMDDSILIKAEGESHTVSTARNAAGVTPNTRREKIILNEVKGFHEEGDMLNSSKKKSRAQNNNKNIPQSPSRMLLEEL